jgi:hypothetical protein
MKYTVSIFAGTVDGAMDYESRPIHRIIAFPDNVSIEVNFDEIGGSHFVVTKTVRIDQKMRVWPRDP